MAAEPRLTCPVPRPASALRSARPWLCSAYSRNGIHCTADSAAPSSTASVTRKRPCASHRRHSAHRPATAPATKAVSGCPPSTSSAKAPASTATRRRLRSCTTRSTAQKHNGSASRVCDSAYSSQSTWCPPKPKASDPASAAAFDRSSRLRNSHVNCAERASTSTPAIHGTSVTGSTAASAVSGCSSELVMFPRKGWPPAPPGTRAAMISVVIPVYNEAGCLPDHVDALRPLLQSLSPDDWEIVLVDDGSSDGTGDVIARLAQDPRVRGATHPRNLGKGAAVRTGVLASRGDAVLMCDADMSTPPATLGEFLAALRQGA